MSDNASFWSKTVEVGSCLEWSGSRHKKGYGSTTHKGKTVRAHRVAWLITYGPIPQGLMVLHKCDNPPCVNPLHLFLGTHKDNMKDMCDKDRQSPRTFYGETNPSAKLTWQIVSDIRASHESCTRLAQEHGVSINLISQIKRYKKWKHNPGHEGI